MANEMTKKAAKLANEVYLENNKPKASLEPVFAEEKPKRVRVNVKDLHELPARLELVNSNMQLVSLLAKSEAKAKKIFADAQAQLKEANREIASLTARNGSLSFNNRDLKGKNQQLVLEEAQGALELEEGHERERAIAALLEEYRLSHIRGTTSHARLKLAHDKLIDKQIVIDQANDDWRKFLLFAGSFLAMCGVIAWFFQ